MSVDRRTILCPNTDIRNVTVLIPPPITSVQIIPINMFGSSAGDIIAISRLAIKVYTAYKYPPGYRHISDEVKSLQIISDKSAWHLKSTSRNVDFTRRTDAEQTALHYAVEGGHTVELLFTKGASIEARSENSYTALP